MKEKYFKVLFYFVLFFLISFVIGFLYQAEGNGLEEKLSLLLKEYGYYILFLWSILEGELGLIMGGIMSKLGYMNLYIAIFIAGLGGFVGDQIYFYIGRYNQDYIRKKMIKQHDKFEKAHELLDKYGWIMIFVQRYMYGLRTVLPISIGLTHYSSKKYAFINFISAQIWAAVTIVLAYVFGEELLKMIHFVKDFLLTHLEYPFAFIFFILIIVFWIYKKKKS